MRRKRYPIKMKFTVVQDYLAGEINCKGLERKFGVATRDINQWVITYSRSGIKHKAVRKLILKINLRGMVQIKKYQSYKCEAKKIAPNLFNRDFALQGPIKNGRPMSLSYP